MIRTVETSPQGKWGVTASGQRVYAAEFCERAVRIARETGKTIPQVDEERDGMTFVTPAGNG
ncbi:hypothetical protein ACIRPX_18590 [Streptomyces sp. NPDC101225]|uniref:hypothetical protein n=1 Tax=Streptomyces sp. NPDC101225 TaxID=3366135 RepID=UPI003826D3BF